MATTVVKIIGTGGDYTTLQAWEDACPANLVVADQIWQGKVKNQEFVSASSLLTISGTTVDATRYVELTTDAGASFIDNANLQTNAFRYNAANGAAIKMTGSWAPGVTVNQNYTRISKIQFIHTINGSGSAAPLNVSTGGGYSNCDIDQCIFESFNNAPAGGAGSGSLAGYGSHKVRNSLIVQRSAANGVAVATLGGGMSAYNCTIVATNPGTGVVGIQGSYGSPVLKNVYVGNVATVTGGSSNYTKTSCYTSVSGPPAGWSGVVPFSTATFANVTDGTHDFRLASGSGLIDVGTTDATNAGTSANNVARPSGAAYDVGAWEYVAAGGGAAALAGNATDTAAGSGTLTTGIRLGGAANATASASGTLAGGAAALDGSATDTAAASGTLSSVPSIIIPELKNGAGTPLHGHAIDKVYIKDYDTDAPVTTLLGLVSSATDGTTRAQYAGLVPGSHYRVTVVIDGGVLAGGSEGTWIYPAA